MNAHALDDSKITELEGLLEMRPKLVIQISSEIFSDIKSRQPQRVLQAVSKELDWIEQALKDPDKYKIEKQSVCVNLKLWEDKLLRFVASLLPRN